MERYRIEENPMDVQPLELARLELSLKLMPDGRKAVGFLATTPEADTPSLFDLYGMLGFAQATIADPDWLAEAYECEED